MTSVCKNSSTIRTIGYKNKAELDKAVDRFEPFIFAVQFSDGLSGIVDNANLPSNLDVTLRLPSERMSQKYEWHTDLLFPPVQTPGPREPHDEVGGKPGYLYRGFLYLQNALTLAIMNDGEIVPPKLTIQMQRFPYPLWVNDLFYISQMETMVSILIMISFLYNYINIIRAITTEKEKQLKESMKIMGLPGWLHWLAWFLQSFIILLLALILIEILLKINIGKAVVFPHSNGGVLFVFFVLFACNTITFAFLVSVFFSKANTAVAVGCLIYFLTYMPYALQRRSSLGPILASTLLTNSALAFGFSVIFKFESIEEGSKWRNHWSTVSPDEHITLGAIFLMLIVDTILYLALTLYVEAIFPGEFGVPQHWNFPFSKEYWHNTPAPSGLGTEDNVSNHDNTHFEKFTKDLPVGIEIRNLSKSFGSNCVVKNLNLDMYEGHITVLLGHNGAGKTTTISMITGMIPPSEGTVLVNGYDVRTHTQSVRDSMGLCLQHNVLFDNLTVAEHLYFFGKLKGLNNVEVSQEIDNYICRLELEDKRNARSGTLSGGMKRKLSVAMALCGKSKVVMLDEPTAGMDPSARRAVWNLLQEQKKGRTILLTTHFMDEADLLGDRIAIMTSGELQCCGSSFFLKRQFGTGYHLIMEVTPACQSDKITSLLREHVPNVQFRSRVGSELTYQLSDSDSGKFEDLLKALETKMSSLGIRSYGISLTTLEEVFMKVGTGHISNESESGRQTADESAGDILKVDYLTGMVLIKNQFIAMVLKKFLYNLRNWHLLVLQIFVPVALLLMVAFSPENNTSIDMFPPLKITLDLYDEPVTLLTGTNSRYYDIYRRYILQDHELKEVSYIRTKIVALTAKNPSVVNRRYIVAASFDDNASIAWFNGESYHSPPLALSLVLNTLYKEKFGEKYSLTFYNDPLPLSLDAQLNSLDFKALVYQVAVLVGAGLTFAGAIFILFYIRERISKFKHLQYVSGANVIVFWATSSFFDMILYVVVTAAVLITLAAIRIEGFKTFEQLASLATLISNFTVLVLPFTFLSVYFFTIPSSGFITIILIGALTGIVGLTVMQILEIEALGVLHIANIYHTILLFFPFYALTKGTYDLGTLYNLKSICLKKDPSLEEACSKNEMCCNLNVFSWKRPGIALNLLILFVMRIFLFAALMLKEFGLIAHFIHQITDRNKSPVQNIPLESDVAAENARIRNMPEDELRTKYALVLRDVTKYYKKFLAVNGLCLGVEPYECFGLLGANGAGKTTTFKMMTGDELISYGEVWINGLNLERDRKKVRKLIGYCPQFDALLDDLTVRETLKIFSLIRGVPYKECKSLGERLAHEFDFFDHIDKKIKELSGGNKRKLSTALALLGNPSIIFLDEPTTGMDPSTKRFLWTALARLRSSGKCIILTSHSMEECEALCTRLAIMANGSFQCLGSIQRLKNKFAAGYALTIKVKRTDDRVNLEDILAINVFIQKNFPNAQLKEKRQEMLFYHLVNERMPWSKMFGILEGNKSRLNIEDYSLGQCSLEQVFLSFTKYQK
ncbi:phospholipid-transporting ATPase ABCA3-like isoform X2 [Tenebrio molitor]